MQGKKTTLTIEQIEKINELYVGQRLSVDMVAQLISVGRNTVNKYLRQNNLMRDRKTASIEGTLDRDRKRKTFEFLRRTG
jgi:phage antirepressor YoqD-like protein